MPKKKLSRVKRRANVEIIHALCVVGNVVYHELWRSVNTDLQEGLTEKEREYLMKRVTLLRRLLDDIGKFDQHLRKNP